MEATELGVDLTFLTPLGAALGLGVLFPLLALALARRRAGHVRGSLGVTDSLVRPVAVALGTLAVTGTFLGLAGAQPVLHETRTFDVRTDAEVWIVVDTSRSMLAQESPGSTMRIARAKHAAGSLRAGLVGVPVGIASLTDRMLPHLFPGPDEDVFQATLERAIGVERPPPSGSFRTNATKLDSLSATRSLRFFSPSARRRVLVVFTDGETVPVNRARLAAMLRRAPMIDTVLVQVWREGEQIFNRRVPEPQYRSDPESRVALEGIAAAIDGVVYPEGESGRATAKVRELLGSGPTKVEGERRRAIALAPFLTAAAFLPLALLLGRRER